MRYVNKICKDLLIALNTKNLLSLFRYFVMSCLDLSTTDSESNEISLGSVMNMRKR